jgi:argininosuccinate lyase
VKAALAVFAPMLVEARVNAGSCAAAVSDPNLLATDLADYLVNRGLPFRKAHEVIGRAVARCAELGCGLDRLAVSEYQALSALFDDNVHSILEVQRSMQARRAVGAPSPENVLGELERWKALLD